MMRLRLCTRPDRVEAHFSDNGIVVSLPSIPADDETEADPLALPEGGRGLTNAKAYLTQLDYRRAATDRTSGGL